MERRSHHSVAELLQQDQYTPEEVADLLEIGLDVVRHAAFSGSCAPRSPSTTSLASAATTSWPGYKTAGDRALHPLRQQSGKIRRDPAGDRRGRL